MTPIHQYIYSAYVQRGGQAFTLIPESNPLVYKGVWDNGTPVWCVTLRALLDTDPVAIAEAFEPCGLSDDDLAAVVEQLLTHVNAYFDAIGEQDRKRQETARAILGKSPLLQAAAKAREESQLASPSPARSLAERNPSLFGAEDEG